MATQNHPLVAEVESLILQSRTITLEDKQQLLKTLPRLTESQLQQMKQVFEEEKTEVERIVKQELFAWNQFHLALASITETTKQRLSHG